MKVKKRARRKVKRGPKPKTVEEHIRDGTYRPKDHAPKVKQQFQSNKPKLILPCQHIDIVTKRWIKNEQDEKAVIAGCRFDERFPDYFIDCWKKHIKHSKGKWAGQPFIPLDWQANDIVFPLYGWLRPDGLRRFRVVYCEIAKKNGKSTLAAVIGINGLIFDEEPGSEVYSCAADKDQASIVHSEAIRMVEASLYLKTQTKINRTTRAITHKESNSIYRALSSSKQGKEGYNIHTAIIDELHVWPDRDVWDALEYGFVNRDQPIKFIITTAGEDMQGICREQHDYAMGVNSGIINDQEFLGIIYAADEQNWRDEEEWYKANPSMGHTIKIEEMRKTYSRLKDKPSDIPNFKRRRLDIWCTSTKVWIEGEDWKKNAIDDFDFDKLRGEFCTIGIDLAKTRDMTSCVFVFPNYDKEKNIFLWPHIYLPEKRIEQINHLIVDLEQWVDLGDLKETEGYVCDYDYILSDIQKIVDDYHLNVVEIVFDPYNAEMFTKDLAERLTCERFSFGQSIANYAEPCEEFERQVIRGSMHHPNNRVMNWQFSHCLVYTDKGGRIKPERRTKDDIRTIDSCVSAVMGYARREAIDNMYFDGAGVY